MRNLTRLLGNILTTLSLMILVACGRGDSPGPLEEDRNGTGGLVNLPSPVELAGRGVSFTELGLMREGSSFDSGLPHNLVTANTTDAQFTPSFGSTKTSTHLAYAVYGFDVSGYDRDLNVRLTWGVAPGPGACYVALANYSRNRWEWRALPPTNVISFAVLNDYTSPVNGNLYIAVVLTGTTPSTLDRLRVGAQPTPGNPNADLQANPLNGPAPLDATFDASASTAAAPASLVKYELDLGTGAGFQMLGSSTTINHQYSEDGAYTAVLRVTDDFGGQDTASVTITVGTAGGGLPSANLIASPSAGVAPLNVILDASASADLPPGSIASYEFDPEGDGSFLAPQAGPTLSIQFHASSTPAVRITDDDGNVATATATVLIYDEVENNDSRTTANSFPALPFSGFAGNIGFGGVYDNDDNDYFSFTAASGDVVRIDTTATAGSLLEMQLFDAAGNFLGFTGFDDGDGMLIHTVMPGEAPYVLVLYHNLGPAVDYHISVTRDP